MPSTAGRLKAAAAAVVAQQKAAASADARDASDDTTSAANESLPTPNALHAVSAFKGPLDMGNQRQSKRASQKLRSAALALTLTSNATIPWGDLDFLSDESIDIATLSNEKLKRHLRARDEVAEGTKQELVERLINSLEEEKQRKIAIELELEAKHRAVADLEELGAVYVTGKNHAGQCGLGDLDDRHAFEVIPATRGKRVQHVSVGGNVSIATTEAHEVYAWGAGPTGLVNSHQTAVYKTPQLVSKLSGEEVVMTAIGANHACAASEGGDLFVWGFGVVGAGDATKALTPQPQYLDAITAASIDCGEIHTCVRTKENEVYTFGHGANGRLGHGRCDSYHQFTPLPVRLPSEAVTLIACGSEHTLLCTRSALYSFGCGDGGRLGHGSDCSDRYEPCEITSLRGNHILSIDAGTWHSACIVHVPPLDDSGWLYTWGSGFVGQLAQGTVCKVSTPALVKHFVDEGLSVKAIHCGPTHNAAITNDGNVYTWGSNKHGALGRAIDETNVPFTPRPGVVAEFGTIVNRIGRGLPRSIACGREYTFVATHPYTGPTEEETLKLAEQKRKHDEAERTKQAALMQAEEDERRRIEEIEAEKRKIQYLTSRRLCTMDPKCPGFTYETSQPSICRECGFSVVYHTIVAEEQRE